MSLITVSNNSATSQALLNQSTPESLYNNLSNFIGRPHSFLNSADPNMRTFVRHMMPAAPLVMIRPGRVKFSEDTTSIITNVLTQFGYSAEDALNIAKGSSSVDPETGKPITSGLFGGLYGVSAEDASAIQKAITEKQRGTVSDFVEKNSNSIRYFEFNSDLNVQREFQSVLSTLSGRLYSRMKGETVLWGNINNKSWTPPPTNYGGFYTFWADNASSVSESASSEVGASKLAGMVKGVSDISREAQFFLGSNLHSDHGKIDSMNKSAIDTALEGIANFIGGDARGLRSSLGDAILGMNPMFPEVWKDSSFGRSYNLSFKFFSPYGAPAAIYQNVLQPFMMLMSLVMPVMTKPGVYTEPFIFQLDCPGYFACDLGICTDFSFTKGGSENLWTVDGLPRQIDVTMSIKDLYPVLTASKNNQSMYFNIGMGTFLDNLAGINLFQGKQGKGDLITRMKSQLTSGLSQTAALPGQLESSAQIFLEQKTPIPSLFR
jgi:hypothetical protein